MIHVATVHWLTDRWIDVQLRRLERFAAREYLVYAFLNGIDESYDARFHFVSRSAGRHAEKLNLLAERVGAEAADDDLLVFLDGDAFPVAELAPRLDEMLARRPLVAIRRDENLGEPQPHPSFCATTVGFWKEIGGDWSPGHRWQTTAGKMVTDVGGNLLGELERRGIEWEPLLRTNVRNLHPLWFGVYENLVYHHGAGFRRPMSRVDKEQVHHPSRVPVVRRLEYEWSKLQKWRRMRESERLSDLVFARLQSDDDFYRELFL